ncbi:MAG: hypothetical protein IJ601_06615 [Acidaminococcaceae bacterium]|nr:hypothetical protein [Acidaminococcaceae bacterium]
MTSIEIARRLAELGQKEKAVEAYTLVIGGDAEPVELLEAAAYLLDNGGNYQTSYTTFVQLYNAGYFREDILPLMTKVFYEPNIRRIKNRYERNCRLLEKYPYLFRKDFPAFEDLPISFIPYDDHHGYVPFDLRTGEFLGFVNVRNPVITRNFFKDLEKPILASDVFSQYELEYLRDNVRRSEDVARENHIYLHYTSWEDFCAWLQVLNMKLLLEEKKIVFLVGEEISQYPIDFKERFHIDYEKFTVQPVAIQEVNRMIWHTQLSTHNGGDFFNEIFDAHPNLLQMPSIMFYNIEEVVANAREAIRNAATLQQAQANLAAWDSPEVVRNLFQLRSPTDKDLLVAVFMAQKEYNRFIDPAARIAPALYFQPHFHNIVYSIRFSKQRGGEYAAELDAENLEQIHKSPIFRSFKYIKTFTPMRRFTTSHGATVRFMYGSARSKNNGLDGKIAVVPDAVTQRVLNRSYMRDPDDRLYQDSVIVRLEDGKLNPKATLTRLAAFLDLPYTESMTYCSEKGEHDPGKQWGDDNYAAGFSLTSVYKTYDDFVNDSERRYIEYFLRDAYAFYGYDFHYYDGSPVEPATVEDWLSHFDTIDSYIRKTWDKLYTMVTVSQEDGSEVTVDTNEQIRDALVSQEIDKFHANRRRNSEILMQGLRFVNRRGQPLVMTPLLQPDPELLENPIYH